MRKNVINVESSGELLDAMKGVKCWIGYAADLDSEDEIRQKAARRLGVDQDDVLLLRKVNDKFVLWFAGRIER